MAGVTDQITQYYNDPSIGDAKAAADNAAQKAQNYQSAAALLPSKLRDAIQQKLDYNKDIIDSKNKAQADYFAAPSAARSQYQDIFNPFDREKLVAQAVSNAYAPYASLVDILGERRGQINDIVNAGTGAFNAQVGAEQNAAQLARQNYTDRLGLADKLAGIAQWGYEQTHKASSGGSGIDPTSLLALMNGGFSQGSNNLQPVKQLATIGSNDENQAKTYADQMEQYYGKQYGYKKNPQGGYQIWELGTGGGGSSNDPIGVLGN